MFAMWRSFAVFILVACIAVVVVASSDGDASSFIDMKYFTFLLGILLPVMLALWETWRHSKGSMLATPWSVGTAAETTLDQSSAGSPADNAKSDEQKTVFLQKTVKVIYASCKGTAKQFAERVVASAAKYGWEAHLVDPASYDPDSLPDEDMVVFVGATYTDGEPPEHASSFYHYLKGMSVDHRVPRSYLSGVKFCVFGCGNSEYKEFNTVAREMDHMLHFLGGSRMHGLGLGDNVDNRLHDHFDRWLGGFEKRMGMGAPVKPPRTTTEEMQEESDDEDPDTEPLLDLEDLGGVYEKAVKKKVGKKATKKPKVKPASSCGEDGGCGNADCGGDCGGLCGQEEGEKKEMVQENSALARSLTKQGYRLIGSHSGVKLCRWTKAMLRGRGGCYKHTFYGIDSYSCMEATPSLACANKCVFCWRHHDNPVGTSFRWKTDSAVELVDGMMTQHMSMMKQLKGVPGVKMDRYEEACRLIKHCALSLVGEPIMYPHINEFLHLLHKRGISTFMVTNAQFPEEMRQLTACTQLYVSIDAPTPEELRLIDRPLFDDFWDRFINSIDELKKKQQRTVFRLTLVNEWNLSAMQSYADLVLRGEPDFVEVKGVTYCGDSKASPLTIKNCPFHEEVRQYCQELTLLLGGDYEIASEHAHSNCVLIAHKKFYVDNSWHTWIDYAKFTQLANSGKPFTSLDYMAPTPEWGCFSWANVDGGFDPEEERFKGKGGKIVQSQGC